MHTLSFTHTAGEKKKVLISGNFPSLKYHLNVQHALLQASTSGQMPVWCETSLTEFKAVSETGVDRLTELTG